MQKSPENWVKLTLVGWLFPFFFTQIGLFSKNYLTSVHNKTVKRWTDFAIQPTQIQSSTQFAWSKLTQSAQNPQQLSEWVRKIAQEYFVFKELTLPFTVEDNFEAWMNLTGKSGVSGENACKHMDSCEDTNSTQEGQSPDSNPELENHSIHHATYINLCLIKQKVWLHSFYRDPFMLFGRKNEMP